MTPCCKLPTEIKNVKKTLVKMVRAKKTNKQKKTGLHGLDKLCLHVKP